MKKFNAILEKYNYSFPEELIAQKPAHPRNSAKLLVYQGNTGEISLDTYKNIGKYLPKGSHLVFNQTKVVPARLIVKKATGGQAKLLYIDHDEKYIRAISDRKLNVGTTLSLASYKLEVVKQSENFYFLKPSFSLKNTFQILSKHGITPIPPYIKHSPLSEKKLRTEYQTVFAKINGSVAAPTASLHFSKVLLSKLKKQGVNIHFLTLHVNMGTFAPLTEQNIKSGKLHSEYYEVNKKTAEVLNGAKKRGEKIIAVGTTVVRTLESAVVDRKLTKLSGSTQLFIQPGYKFKFVDALATNFHVPKSSLMMLVSTIVGREKLLALYRLAIKKKFRLFSFGDGMLIL